MSEPTLRGLVYSIFTSQVCSAWRKATSSPRVWSYLYVNCDDGNVVTRTRFWLSKSLHAPLRITIRATAIHRTFQQAMQALSAHSRQWREIQISSPRYKVANAIMKHAYAPAPQLVRVDLEVDDPSAPTEIEADDLLLEPFKSAPNLQDFAFTCPTMQPPLSFPAQIVNLRLALEPNEEAAGIFSVPYIQVLLRSLPQLKTFSLSITAASFAGIQVPADNTLLALELESFTLETTSGGWILFNYLELPRLRKLHLICLPENALGYPDSIAGTLLRRFLAASTPPLEVLELYDIDISDADFSACFDALPTLRDLRLHSSDISDSVLARLHGGVWCPDLARLDLRWCGTLTGRTLVELVASRAGQDGCAAIEEITVIHCAFVGEDDVLALARLTTCRVVHRDGEHLGGHRNCCDNVRYRQRLRLRHLKEFMAHHGTPLRLVL